MLSIMYKINQHFKFLNLNSMKKLTSISLAIVLMAGLFLGCKKTDDQVAPILPPAGSMTIDFSNFTSTQKSATIESQVNGVAAADKSNLNTAVLIAGVWNYILGVNLVVPVSSFKLAMNSTPTFLGENKWEWKYSFDVVGGTKYKARLTGLVGSSDVKWEMYISREGVSNAFSEVKWFEGSSALDGKSGQWTLNHSKEFLEPMLQIDWVAVGTGMGKIKYTYVRETKDDRSADFFKTSSIEYGLTANPLNAYYNVHQNTGVANSFNDVNIEWSTTTFNGHIKSNNVFFNDLWHCWNGTGDNVDCN